MIGTGALRSWTTALSGGPMTVRACSTMTGDRGRAAVSEPCGGTIVCAVPVVSAEDRIFERSVAAGAGAGGDATATGGGVDRIATTSGWCWVACSRTAPAGSACGGGAFDDSTAVSAGDATITV